MKLQSDVDNLDPENNERAELEDICVTTKSLFLSLLAKNRQPNVARLPNMKLPKFNGEYSDYKHFVSLLENLVHNDPTWTDIEKFKHLMSCLSDEALGTVISEQNYHKAIASLKKVYDNDCLIKGDFSHWNRDCPRTTQ